MRHTLKFSVLVILVLMVSIMFTACSGEKSDVPEEQQFTWWITKTDGQGEYYLTYEDNPAAQWLNNQKWSQETGSYTTDGTGTKLDISYMVPVTGSESDNFNTMIATGSYPEVVDLTYSNDSPRQLHDDGVLMEITDYVEAYMPDYLSFLDENPELKPFVSYTDENDDIHYYSVYGLQDAPVNPWQGCMYRRDWIVTYGNPTSYVWDLESEYIMNHGHPEIPILEDALSANNLNGWKENEITSFTSNWGDDDTWEDNIIFPSGTENPLYVSDWEWMLEMFVDAIENEGYANDASAYATTLYHLGYLQTGDLVSSFGGGGPMWYVDDNGDAQFGATGENFKTYVEAMNTWYENGWLDTRFETRGSDQFFQINRTGVSQGKVGLFVGGIAYLGTTIRQTVAYEDAKDKAMVYGAALPINDVYGNEDNKYIEPDTFYTEALVGLPVGITEAAEGKDLASLFTMMNWLYTDEGSLLFSIGLNEEQYNSMTFSPDIYAQYGIDRAYNVVLNDDDTITYINTVPQSNSLSNAIKLNRINTRLSRRGVTGEYQIDFGYNDIASIALVQWRLYENTGYILSYNELFDEDQSSLYSKTNTYINDSMGVDIPKMIKEGLASWDVYVSKINKYGPQRVTTGYQEILDKIS